MAYLTHDVSGQHQHIIFENIGSVLAGDQDFSSCSSNTFYVHLNIGDDVYVTHEAEGDLLRENSAWSDPSFSGALLHADSVGVRSSCSSSFLLQLLWIAVRSLLQILLNLPIRLLLFLPPPPPLDSRSLPPPNTPQSPHKAAPLPPPPPLDSRSLSPSR
ncbi:hypothetical protein MAR_014097 [Mya arenaria]|uniref:Uncharacterized protein n=1 Tax=Mya arenaria TaxID=6604 RepID=A0ABY7G1S4_MYAAR|nr:hypothetical protein MAR_014097 [Mya arenaria]